MACLPSSLFFSFFEIFFNRALDLSDVLWFVSYEPMNDMELGVRELLFL